MTHKEIFIVTAALLLSNAMAGLDATIINTALPSIVSDLNAIQYMGWIVSVFLLGMAIATPLWSKFGERVGNRKAYQLATVLFAIGSLLQAISRDVPFFLVARALMGIGAGGMNTMPFIIYADLYKQPQRRARIIGYATASFSAASIIGPLIGGWIVDVFNWHWVFYINLPIALISIVCIQMFFKEPVKTPVGKKVDYLGAGIMIAGLMTLLTGIQMIGVGSTGFIIVLLTAGFLLLALLFKVEETAEDPIIPNRLFKNHALVVDFLLFALLWGAFIAFNIYVPLWAQGLLGLSAFIGGMTQIPGAVTNFAGSMTGPFVQPQLGKYNVVALGTLAFLISFGGLAFANADTPFMLLLILGAFEGFGLGLCFNVLQISVQEDAEKQDVPIATSFAYLLRILSQAFMSSLYGVIMTRSLMQGVSASNGTISIAMLNQLSDSKSANNLPADLVPSMKNIMFQGLHSIMMTALILLGLALAFNLGTQFTLSIKKADSL
ncbi:MAG: hypothetical protein PWQ12_1205 [Clostridiales bacterium]|nr:hypothetical protein [Clostridiales bacterium]